jgi:hypothetical protein
MLAIFEQMALELRYHYQLRFKPLLPSPDNKWHSVKIKLTLPERDQNGRKFAHLIMRSRLGYFDR